MDFEHGAAVKEWRGHKREVNRLALLQVILREPHAPNLEKQARTLNVASECCLAVRIAGAHHRCARRPGDDIQSCCLLLKIRALTASCEDQNANTRHAVDGASSVRAERACASTCEHSAPATTAFAFVERPGILAQRGGFTKHALAWTRRRYCGTPVLSWPYCAMPVLSWPSCAVTHRHPMPVLSQPGQAVPCTYRDTVRCPYCAHQTKTTD